MRPFNFAPDSKAALGPSISNAIVCFYTIVNILHVVAMVNSLLVTFGMVKKYQKPSCYIYESKLGLIPL